MTPEQAPSSSWWTRKRLFAALAGVAAVALALAVALVVLATSSDDQSGGGGGGGDYSDAYHAGNVYPLNEGKDDVTDDSEREALCSGGAINYAGTDDGPDFKDFYGGCLAYYYP